MRVVKEVLGESEAREVVRDMDRERLCNGRSPSALTLCAITQISEGGMN